MQILPLAISHFITIMTHFLVLLFFACVIHPLKISGTHFISHRFQIPILPYYFRSLHWLYLQLRSGLIKCSFCILNSQQIKLILQLGLSCSLVSHRLLVYDLHTLFCQLFTFAFAP